MSKDIYSDINEKVIEPSEVRTGVVEADEYIGVEGGEHDHTGDDLNPDSVSTGVLGNGPTVYASQYGTVQAAIDAAADGKLVIDETVEENGITVGNANNGLTIEWLGNNWIDQPQAANLSGTSVFVEADLESVDLTLMNPQVRNPYLTDSDIETWDTISNSADRSGFLPNWDGDLEIYGGHIHHLNGYGIYGKSTVKVFGTQVEWVTYDGFRGDGGDDIVFEGVTSVRAGRAGIIADGEFGNARISGLVDQAYMSGIRIITSNTSSTTNLDATIRNSTGWDGAGSSNHGANATLQGTITGNLEIVNPTTETDSAGEEVVRLAGKADGLNLSIWSSTQLDLSTGAIFANLTGEGNRLSATVDNVGNSSSQAVEVITGRRDIHEFLVRNAPGESIDINRTNKSMIDVMSEDPGASGVDTAHILLEGLSGDQALDNDVRLICEGSNPDHAVRSNGNSDYNRFYGNVRGAYANSSTSSIGANSDVTDLTS